MPHHTGAREATGKGADEIEGVHLHVLATIAVAEPSSCDACQVELERFSVEVRPLGDDVGHQTSVVAGIEPHRAVDRGVDIDAVRPDTRVIPTSSR